MKGRNNFSGSLDIIRSYLRTAVQIDEVVVGTNKYWEPFLVLLLSRFVTRDPVFCILVRKQLFQSLLLDLLT